MGSKKTIQTSWEYYSTFGQVFGYGLATKLTRLTNGDTEVWSGSLTPADADGDGLTIITTSIGDIRFYWGDPAQNTDAVLSAQVADFGAGPVSLPWSAMRDLSYLVADDIAHGMQVPPPTLKLEEERELDLLTLSTHRLSGDCVLPEHIYEVYTDAVNGAGLAVGDIDVDSFEAAAETIIDEDLGVSPYLNERTSVREYVAKLLQYIDGFLRMQDGKLALVLIRPEDTSGTITIDESTLVEEPRPVNEGWVSTWNQTNVVFTDADNEWEEQAIETYVDPANLAARGEVVAQEVNLPWVTRRAVAKMLAKRKGLAGGVPRQTWELRVMPSLRSLRPGDLVFLSYAKRGIVSRLCRVEETGRDTSENRHIKLLVTEELTRDEANDYTPPADDYLGLDPYLGEGGGNAFVLADLVPLVAVPPTELLDGHADGMLIVAARSTPLVDGMEVFFTHDPLERGFTTIDAAAAFPAGAEILWWTPTRTNTSWIARIEFASQSDAEYATLLAQGAEDAWLVACQRDWQTVAGTIDEHQVTTIWLLLRQGGYLVPISDTIIEFEFIEASYSTPEPVAETDTDPGIHPTVTGFIGRLVDFTIHQTDTLNLARNAGNTPDDTDLLRYFRAAAQNAGDSQVVADAGEVTYDRNDTTMCPEGTFDPDWGARAPHLPEIADELLGLRVEGTPGADDALIDALDDALGRILEGTETADDLVLADETNFILGDRVTYGWATWGRNP